MNIKVLGGQAEREFKDGDIFFMEYTGGYYKLTPTHYNEDGVSMYSLISLGKFSGFYSSGSSNVTYSQLVDYIKSEKYIHYSKDDFDFNLEIAPRGKVYAK